MTSTVLVTGGNRGIGLEMVKGFAKQGCKVLLGCREEDDGLKAKEDVVGADIQVIEIDLNDKQSLQDNVVRAQAVFGDIDVLVNNAGVLCEDNWERVSDDALKEAMQVHVHGPMAIIRHVLPAMIERNYGRIVNVSSGWGAFSEGMEGPPAYALSKAAMNALTLHLARKIDADNVKINAMSPGWVHTRMGGSDAPLTPEEGAETAIWLGLLDEDGPTGKFFRDKQLIEW
ncbi:SDR family NAD(P)-dependent oxidoreductase [Aestuariibacter sp. A3R04]|uniref:SDR family NAD(P)-dependent oxidoreductase n=1 Tax=Aestuariibacter sp. A3R04 TaxID=2841571 RepID=UPI001C093BEB|nr:SDR family NAD(P)-dependent oxidoreductase [Aestuariibacter sp. A3R04]MBU3023015.1 SDR family NAD(P)-dependent oxidoreductase [Aestuariibacter sp. A3R04]